MNRLRKEQIRHYMRANIHKLDLDERKRFVALFSSDPDKSIYKIIDTINGKMLRRAHKYIRQALKICKYNDLD